jgi:hypothetical protein
VGGLFNAESVVVVGVSENIDNLRMLKLKKSRFQCPRLDPLSKSWT